MSRVFLAVNPELTENGHIHQHLEPCTHKQLNWCRLCTVVAEFVHVSEEPHANQDKRETLGVFAFKVKFELRGADDSLEV